MGDHSIHLLFQYGNSKSVYHVNSFTGTAIVDFSHVKNSFKYVSTYIFISVKIDEVKDVAARTLY